MTRTTHTKKAARALARTEGITYVEALRRVRAGRSPALASPGSTRRLDLTDLRPLTDADGDNCFRPRTARGPFTEFLATGLPFQFKVDDTPNWVDRDAGAFPYVTNCAACGKPIQLASPDADWVHLGTGDACGHATSSWDVDGYWHPLTTLDQQYLTRSPINEQFTLTRTVLLRDATGAPVTALNPVGEFPYGWYADDADLADDGRVAALAAAAQCVERLTRLVDPLGGVVLLAEGPDNDVEHAEHLVQAYVPLDAVKNAFPAPRTWFRAFLDAVTAPTVGDVVYQLNRFADPVDAVRVVNADGTSYPPNMDGIVRHSPTGWNWGYDGSGPADTAYAILRDAVGPTLARQLYRRYKADVIAVLDQHASHTVTRSSARDWTANTGATPGIPVDLDTWVKIDAYLTALPDPVRESLAATLIAARHAIQPREAGNDATMHLAVTAWRSLDPTTQSAWTTDSVDAGFSDTDPRHESSQENSLVAEVDAALTFLDLAIPDVSMDAALALT